MCRGGCAYELKFDGWRSAAGVTTNGVFLQSRSLKLLTPYFPDVVAQLSELPAGTVLDGELISWDTAAGRTSFTALQRRVTAGRGLAKEAKARPATFVCFDLLHDSSGDLRNLTLADRRTRLLMLLEGAPPALQICPQTTNYDEARTWLDMYAPTGCEGLLIKDLTGRYRTSGWWKYKLKTTTEALIAGLTGTVTSPSTLLLGRRDARGRLRFVGRTSALTAPQRLEITKMATPITAGVRHPWPHPLPAMWTGQFDRKEPLDYVPVKPHLVAEIIVDQAYEAGRYRHPVKHLRLRAEMDASDVLLWAYDAPSA
jgi:ATP-dependent DNA ligase